MESEKEPLAPGGDFAERCVGSLLGTAFGDALGAAVEGMDGATIRERHGAVRDFLPSGGEAGRYTDDTQMTLALTHSLVRCGGVDGADCARSYAEFFEAERGYGRSASAVLEALRGGADYRQTGTMFFAEGSFGNGAAMRIAPLGLLFGPVDVDALRCGVFEAVRCTHVHPQAIDAATVQALSVALMASAPMGRPPQAQGILVPLLAACRTDALRRAVAQVGKLLREGATDAHAATVLGTRVTAVESVPAALFAALRYAADPEEALINAVGMGGDTDTIAAMTGALVGALHGPDGFPRRWHNTLENGPAIVRAALALAKLCRWAVPGFSVDFCR